MSAGRIKKKQSTNIKRDEINIMTITNYYTFNLYNSLVNNDNWHMKVSIKFKLIGVARLLIWADIVNCKPTYGIRDVGEF